ncbi:MAG: DUF1003 domain-containing protein [Verrucomicrobia bacterium]|nr:DUF1003 domain-containing protein [Verrucomicrobiota bacterium]
MNPPEERSEMLRLVERNISALVERSRESELKRSREQRLADFITHFAGSMRFVYIHLLIYGLWIFVNLGWIPGPKFDPTFVVLAMVASVEAIFLSTFILISQNRMSQLAERRAELDLQISLLAEHEITRLLTLVADIATRMHVDIAERAEVEELKKDIQPREILDEIERRHPDSEL